MDYVEAVLSLVETIPPGRVMSTHGGGVPWHRVVAANGRLVPGHMGEARARLMSEGIVFRGERVDMRRYAWFPPPS